jgi:outer membrane protein TolC
VLAQAELDLARLEIETRLTGLLAHYEASRREGREYDETILPQAREAYRIALRLRALGDASYIEVLSAQTILIASERAATESHLLAATLRAQITALEGLEADEWHTTR